MLYLFDPDGTLISSYIDRADKDYHAWQLLPGRAVRIAELLAANHSVAIITNQGGVAFGHTTEEDFCRKIAEVARQLRIAAVDVHDGRADGPLTMGWGRAIRVFVCYSDERARDVRRRADAHRRKPSGVMIREAMAAAGYEDGMGVLYVGDRPEDEAAARDAGVAFRWADAFFGA
jgi:D-glycero-D-manno-heptose 1,7-bisphosphate phosphatase